MPLGVEHVCREVARRAKYGLFHGVPIRHGFQVSKRGKNKYLHAIPASLYSCFRSQDEANLETERSVSAAVQRSLGSQDQAHSHDHGLEVRDHSSVAFSVISVQED